MLADAAVMAILGAHVRELNDACAPTLLDQYRLLGQRDGNDWRIPLK
jgi:hypothetical protein